MLWQRLRRHQLSGLNFRRQHGIGQFIVDFYCRRAKLVIEVDGPIHQYKAAEDAVRQQYLERLKLKILRYPNEEVLNNADKVIQKVNLYLTQINCPLSASGKRDRKRGR